MKWDDVVVIIERREGLEEVIRLNRCLEAAK